MTGRKGEEPIRDGGNPYCPFCGKRYENKDLIDADHIFLTTLPTRELYGEIWKHQGCEKMYLGTKLPREMWVGFQTRIRPPRRPRRRSE
jgi:hypothetical protein